MKSFSVLGVSTLAAFVTAQSAPNFPVQVDTNLRVDFLNSSTSVSPPGTLLPRDDVLYGPTVYGPENATEEATYMLFMVDEDVNTGNGPRVQLLHYFQPNLVGINHELSVEPNARNATTAVGAEYLTPSPPAGDGPHRYTLLLYPQPEDFTVPQAYISFSPPADVNARYPFNMSGFAEAAGLGQPIAANWFRVVNDTTSTETGSSTTSTASASSSASASASASSSVNSAAGLVEVRGSASELVAGLVMGMAGAWLWIF
ncbi:uncharacterized protein A1O5_12191 [Cladophialophora psammophila CBS 110553]|uniref:Phosphatidylethanolamine-binding protein n=1 Tax=Cladophialophora psammophila CBS 110553 TaxID=1182543 RepID=W9W2R6_9EURO|nr:uncharacterized protein A1O5_12191 [Cladophialophora psammophila CBS 110553]EXJ59310.1 hypothetical protein A1O5_12191 [Cladophialophora psammophila CBS 110553]